jgi:hypothetical protein
MLSSVYDIDGNVADIDAVGKNDGHTAVMDVHPTGISIHTLLNFDPDGRTKFIPFGNPGNAIDKESNNPPHSIVPVGQELLSVPLDPVGPCTPFIPGIVLFPQSAKVLLVPLPPATGEFITDEANDAVSASVILLKGTLAVVANIE